MMNEKVTFQELIDTIAEESNRSKQFTHDFVKDFVAIINDNLEKGETVHIAGFGKFKLRSVDEREGRNPQTGEPITIPEHYKVVFKPYKDLRELVNAPYLHMEPEIIEEEDENEKNDSPSKPDSDEAEQQFIPTAPPPTVQPKSDESVPPSPEEPRAEEQFPDPFELDKDDSQAFSAEDPFGLDKGSEPSADFTFDPTTESDEGDEDIVEFSPEIEAEEPVDLPEIDEEKEEDQTPEDEKEKQEEVQSDDLDSEDELFSDIADPKEEAQSLNQSFEESEEEAEPEEETPAKPPTPTPLFKHRRHKRKRGGGSFLVIIAAVIVLFLLAGSWYFINWAEQQSNGTPAVDTTIQQTSDTQPQTTAGQTQGTDTVADNKVKTIAHTVESGETLWGLANDNYENPYFWPWIYNTNQASISSPNIIKTGQVLDIPQKEEVSGELTENDSLRVAIGYVETYRWYKSNNHEEAKNYLYTAIKYHNEVLQYTDVEIDEEDLAFANQAE